LSLHLGLRNANGGEGDYDEEGEPERIRLRPNRSTITANVDDISSVRVKVVDAEGRLATCVLLQDLV
jgi:hypothetical protein